MSQSLWTCRLKPLSTILKAPRPHGLSLLPDSAHPAICVTHPSFWINAGLKVSNTSHPHTQHLMRHISIPRLVLRPSVLSQFYQNYASAHLQSSSLPNMPNILLFSPGDGISIMDGSSHGTAVDTSLDRPFLPMNAPAQNRSTDPSYETSWANQRGWKLELNVLKSTHTIFCDQAALCEDLRALDAIPDLGGYLERLRESGC